MKHTSIELRHRRRVAVLVAVLLASTCGVGLVGASPAGAAEDEGYLDLHAGNSGTTYICPAPEEPMARTPWCTDGNAARQVGLGRGGYLWFPLPAGTYNASFEEFGSNSRSPIGPIVIAQGATTTCVVTAAAGPTCGDGVTLPDATTGSVSVTMTDPVGSFLLGLCQSPGTPQPTSSTCTDGRSLVGIRSLDGGESEYFSMFPGTYTGLVITPDLTASPIVPFAVVAGARTVCSVSMAAGPVCALAGDEDGDGVPDTEQEATLPPPAGSTSGPIAVRVGSGTRLADASVAPAPAAPPGVQAATGLIGFTVTGLASGATAVVTLTPDTPIVVDGYWKLLGGQWVDATSAATFEPDGSVTLRIVDGGAFDADGAANGTVVDPGILGKRALTQQACKNGGWRNFYGADGKPFRNQGDCVSHANHN